MGIRLVMEAIGRHAPDGLTWRERYVLAVLAATAIDATRKLEPGIEASPELAARLRLGSRSQLYAVLDALVQKGALVHVERGRNGVKAVYAIAPFAPAAECERPGDPDAAPVDNPLERPGNRDSSDGLKGPGSGNEGSRFSGPRVPVSGTQHLIKGVKGFKTSPPTPTQPPLMLAVSGGPEGEGDQSGTDNPDSRVGRRQALVEEVVGMRPEWSRRSVLRALEQRAVTERPWEITAAAMRIIAADPATQHAGRLEYDGPWWAEAASKTRPAQTPATGTHRYEHDPDTGVCTCKAPEVDKCHRQRRLA